MRERTSNTPRNKILKHKGQNNPEKNLELILRLSGTKIYILRNKNYYTKNKNVRKVRKIRNGKSYFKLN
jgi:hypothetical protein